MKRIKSVVKIVGDWLELERVDGTHGGSFGVGRILRSGHASASWPIGSIVTFAEIEACDLGGDRVCVRDDHVFAIVELEEVKREEASGQEATEIDAIDAGEWDTQEEDDEGNA